MNRSSSNFHRGFIRMLRRLFGLYFRRNYICKYFTLDSLYFLLPLFDCVVFLSTYSLLISRIFRYLPVIDIFIIYLENSSYLRYFFIPYQTSYLFIFVDVPMFAFTWSCVISPIHENITPKLWHIPHLHAARIF